ncbi:hypothetical protein [uncultured Corynebacterium sp.]|uniref:hypothetical protein n=1 Tax=uncultured Corynebacterium sp. TaxID=159447 RepID=UPI0025DEB5E7|nr:hypothetical protein [uncultured Corynebacterium sp.]
MMEHYEKPFTVQLEWFRAEAPTRVNAILERHGFSPEKFFATDAFPAEVLSAIRDSATGTDGGDGGDGGDAGNGGNRSGDRDGGKDRARDELVLVMGEWLVQQGCGHWSIGPLDHDRPHTAAIIRLGFGVMITGSGGFAVLASWAEDIVRGGSVQLAADLLSHDARHADRPAP